MKADRLNSLYLRLSDCAGGRIIAGTPDAFTRWALMAIATVELSEAERRALIKNQMTRKHES